MAHQNQKRVDLSTERGKVTICSFCRPDEIESLSLRANLTEYANYNPIFSKKDSLIKAALQPDSNVALAFADNGHIIGLSVLQYPSFEERWSRVGDRIMMEVSAVEVSRPWRSMGISKQLLRFLLDHPLKEDRIFYMVGYSWTWDLDFNDMPVMAYRNMMIKLFSQYGFKLFQTNEPNIMLRPENLFMALIGANISEEVQKRFKLVLFDLDL